MEAAIEWRDAALAEETARAEAEYARVNSLVARLNLETGRADLAEAKAADLEQGSLSLAKRVNELEQVADRLALRVVERERALVKARAELEEAVAAGDALPAPEIATSEAAPDSCVGTAGDVFDGRVEVEVGPLSDFGQLVSFEDAASEIAAAGEISVKGFAQGRATLELHLSEPVELLRELEERAPFEFRVRDTRDDRVVLDVDAEAA